MKFALFLLVILYSITSFSQVGIGTTSPNALLDIRSSSQAAPSNIDGILIPKIDNFPGTPPSVAQNGMMVYFTGNTTYPKGFYYWDNTLTSWKAVGSKKIDDLSDAKSDNTGSSIFLGIDAGSMDDGTDNRNVGIGFNALNSNVGGERNTATGFHTLYGNTTGTNNTAFGYKALENNIDTHSNTAIGSQSLTVNTGAWNTATGSQTLKANISGIKNTANGFQALNKNIDGESNTASGTNALYNNLTGDYNTANGEESLLNLTGGNDNVAIGSFSGKTLTNANRNVFIGVNSGGNETTNNDRLYIENSNSATPLIGGNFATDMVGINRPIDNLTNTFEVGGEASKASAGDWLANSDRRLKKNIYPISGGTALEKISKMNGVSYEWNDTQTGTPRPKGIQYGFIAQELMEVFPEKVIKDKQGFYQTAYGTYDAFYVQAIKELKQELDKKELRIIELENKVNQLQAYKVESEKTNELENRVKKLEALLINKTISKN